MALRQILLNGDPALRMKCRPVDEIDDKIRRLLADMAETMYHTGNGGGLAANQVGVLRRCVVVDMGKGLLKLINPRIVKTSGAQQVVEGCLSFPGVWGELMRPRKVVVEAQNENGETVTVTGEGDLAKCLCHELDHLDGVLFVDKVKRYL